MKGERGFALVITLLITALLVALSVEFVNEVFVDTSSRQGFTDGQQASLMAESGVTAAIAGLKIMKRATPSVTKLEDLDQIAKLLSIKDEIGSLQLAIEDENGKVNLNSAWEDNGPNPPYSDIAERLIRNSGLSPDLFHALVDWRDISDDPETAGAESPYYGTLKPPYTSRNGKLVTVEELRLVKGFDGAAFDRFRPFVTVFESSDVNSNTKINTKININTAPKEVIAALADGMTNDLAQRVIDHRPFDGTNTLLKVPGMETIGIGLSSSTTNNGTVFRIISRATVKETNRVIEAVVNSSWQIIYWREY